MKIKKRNGELVEYDHKKIINAVKKAFLSQNCKYIPDEVLKKLSEENFKDLDYVEDIQDKIELILYHTGYKNVYNSFVMYRGKRALQREENLKKVFNTIINLEKNDITNDNSNMNAESPAGQMMKYASEVTKSFVDNYILTSDIKHAVENNYIYIHDKDYYLTRSLTCLQTPLDKILNNGFTAGHGGARPAKRIETAAVLAAISMETTQNEMHGGQAIPAFDFYMAPFVRKTYIEEIDKISKLYNKDYSHLYDAYIQDYIYIDDLTSDNIFNDNYIKQVAINNTVKRVYQSMESFIHNMNSIHSRGGNQVVFSSINYGTDTSAEGRCIIRELLKTTYKGINNGATAIFPIQVWKLKNGVNKNPGDPNYDLYKYSWKVSARRFFPNYLNLDSSFNYDDNWDKNDPRRFEHEVAAMGCRTRTYSNLFGPKTSIGRGNLSFTTLNLPKLAIEVGIEDNFLIKKYDEYILNTDNNSEQDINRRVLKLKEKLNFYTKLIAKQLDDRFNFQKKALKKQFPLLMSGLWLGSEKLKENDTIESVINQGTLAIGYIGLAEALIAITGHHHGEDKFSQKIGLELISYMNDINNEMCIKYNHNYAIFATPAEGLSGRFTIKDAKEFGKIKGITDKKYYTNSNHVPVYYKCTPQHKAKIEGPYHKLTPGGHIFYIEADADITKNPESIEIINKIACDNDCGYISINHNQGRCINCNYETNDPNITNCPICGGKMDILQRITGYLTSTTDKWCFGKKDELKDRIQHL